MKDMLTGLTTMVILFSMVWLAQSNASPSKNIVETDKQNYNINRSLSFRLCGTNLYRSKKIYKTRY